MAVFPFWCCCGRGEEPQPDECIPFNCVSRQCTYEHPSIITLSGYQWEYFYWWNETNPNAAISVCNGLVAGEDRGSQSGQAILHSHIQGGQIFWATMDPVSMTRSGFSNVCTRRTGFRNQPFDSYTETKLKHFRVHPRCCRSGNENNGEVYFNLYEPLSGVSPHPDSDIPGEPWTQELKWPSGPSVFPGRKTAIILTDPCGNPTGNLQGGGSYTRSATLGCTPGGYTYSATTQGLGWGPNQGSNFSYTLGGDPNGPRPQDFPTLYARVSGVTYKTDCIDFQGTIVDGKYTSMPTDAFNRITSGGWVAISEVSPVGVDQQWEGTFSGVEWTDYDSNDGDCDDDAVHGISATGRGTDNMLIRLSRVGAVYTAELFSDIDSAGAFPSPPAGPFTDRFFVKSAAIAGGCADFDISLGNELTFSNWDGAIADEPLDGSLTLDLGWGGRMRISNRAS